MLGARRGRRGEGLVCRGGSDLCCRRGVLFCFSVCDLSDGVGGVIWLGGWDTLFGFSGYLLLMWQGHLSLRFTRGVYVRR